VDGAFLSEDDVGRGQKSWSKSRHKATRNQSQAEKKAQNEKAQATKAANREKKRKANEEEARKVKAKNKDRFQSLLLGGQTSATSAKSSSAAAASGDRSNSNPNEKAAGSKDNQAGRSTSPREGDALENSNCDTAANQPSIGVDGENEDDEVRCVPAAPSVNPVTNGNACIQAESVAGRSTSADTSPRCIPANNNWRADKPLVMLQKMRPMLLLRLLLLTIVLQQTTKFRCHHR